MNSVSEIRRSNCQWRPRNLSGFAVARASRSSVLARRCRHPMLKPACSTARTAAFRLSTMVTNCIQRDRFASPISVQRSYPAHLARRARRASTDAPMLEVRPRSHRPATMLRTPAHERLEAQQDLLDGELVPGTARSITRGFIRMGGGCWRLCGKREPTIPPRTVTESQSAPLCGPSCWH